MSQNKKKQTAATKTSSTESTESVQTPSETENLNASGEGNTPVSAVGDPDVVSEDSQATADTAEDEVDPDATESLPGQQTEDQDVAVDVKEFSYLGIDQIDVAKKEDYNPPVNHTRPVDAATAKMEWNTLAEESAPNGKIIEPGEEITFDGEEIGNFITITQDVYQKFYPRGTRKPSYSLLYRKGTQVSALSVQSR